MAVDPFGALARPLDAPGDDALAGGGLGREPHVVDRMAGLGWSNWKRVVWSMVKRMAGSIQQELAADFIGERGDVVAYAAPRNLARPISKIWSTRA